MTIAIVQGVILVLNLVVRQSGGTPLPVEERTEWSHAPETIGARIRAAAAHDTVRGRVVLYGGIPRPGQMVYSDLWECDGVRWVKRLPTGLRPPPIWSPLMAFDPVRQETVLVGLEIPDVQRIPTWRWTTWTWNGARWTERLSQQTPSIRADAAMAYDPVHQRVVYFGGILDTQNGPYADTWTWNGSIWTPLATVGSPPARSAAAMGFDPMSGRMILAGGEIRSGRLADCWQLDGVTWTRISDLPSARSLSVAAPDSRLGQLLLHGGFDLLGRGIPELLAWSGSSWRVVPAAMGSPPGLGWAAGVHDPRAGLTLVGGSRQQDGGARGEIWVFDSAAASWSRRIHGQGPPCDGVGGVMVWDARRRRIVLYNDNSEGEYSDAMWEWAGNAWETVPISNRPASVHPGLAFHRPSGKTVLFGGTSPVFPYPSLNQTWEWDGVTWTRRTPSPSPGPRWNHVMVSDPLRGQVLVYGGRGAAADLWSWDGSQWTLVAAACPPGLRDGAVGAFDTARGVLVLFGGYQSNLIRHVYDTWEWDGTVWHAVHPSVGGPPVKIVSGMTYDERRGVCILYGERNAGAPSETWEFDGWRRRWTLRCSGWPAVNVGAALCHDPTRGVTVLHGGAIHQLPNPGSTQTWLYTATDLSPTQQETRVGNRLGWTIMLPVDAGSFFVTGVALGSAGGIQVRSSPLGEPYLWPLQPDLLLRVSLGIPTLRGVLDAQGIGQPYLTLPRDPALAGLYLSASALTLDAFGVRSITRDVRVLIVP